MKKTMLLLLPFVTCFTAPAQISGVSLQKIPDYNQWGWEAIVMQNNLITLATVPAIGGRVLQYDLADYPSIFINQSELGKTYVPANNNQWYNFGGYKAWPAPQSQWNAGGWPPPPILDYGAYTIIDTTRTDDSVSVSVSSQIEQWFAPGIRFERKATLYAGTSRIKMDQTMINEGAQAASWSMWDVTQSIVHHSGKTDYDNYWVYFPINPNSNYGTSGVSFPSNSLAWRGEVLTGVYGVRFYPDNKKIFADPHNGWIAYAVYSDTTVFVKRFCVSDSAQYPDNGARIAVYVGGSNPAYMEVEVTSPIVELAAGGSYTFTENWYSARAHPPIYNVNDVGVKSGPMGYVEAAQKLYATYGLFYEGTARVVFLDAGGTMLTQGISYEVSPLNEFRIQETIAIPESAKSIEILVRNGKGELVGVLDQADVSEIITTVGKNNPVITSEFRLEPSYPNPFNGGTVLTFFCPRPTEGSLKIYDIIGREIAVLKSGNIDAGEHRYRWNPGNISSGIYIAKLELRETLQIQKMMYLR